MGVAEVAGFVALAALLFSIEIVFNWLRRRNLTGSILRSEAGEAVSPLASTMPDTSQGHHHAGVHHSGFGDHGGFDGGQGH